MAERAPRFIAHQIAIGFGTVTIVAVVMCAMLVGIVRDVSSLVAMMRDEETSIREGLALATAVREVSIHIAHTMLEADASHMKHYEEWRGQVQARSAKLAAALPVRERGRVDELAQKAQVLHTRFLSIALPVAQSGDVEAARRAHRELDRLGEDLADDADALAKLAESRMARSHDLATDATSAGLIGGALCILLMVSLSAGFTVRLRVAVLRPLLALTDAARRFGRGDFDLRVGKVGKGELASLAQAFDHMAEELARREARMLHHERMAAIGQLAAGVAHELNNPIGIIRGYLKTMEPDGDPNVLREELAILDEEAAQCQRIADDLLAYARTSEIAVDRIEIGAFLDETVRRFRETSAANSHEVEVVVSDDSVEADGARLRQVVLNLLLNAAQAHQGSEPIVLRGELEGDRYCIEVQDRGPGVDPVDRTRIFEPFFSKRRGGSGLGLAVCLGIARAHDGSIEALERVGGGARLRLCLPRRQPERRSVTEEQR